MTQSRRVAWVVAAQAAVVGMPAAAPAATHNAKERKVIREVNKLRAQHGATRLRPSRALARAADSHSRDMLRADFFAHPSSNGTSTYDRVRRFKKARMIGETLAWVPTGQASPRRVVQMWRDSPGHFRTLTTGSLRRVGVSRKRGRLWGDDVVVYTLNLSSKR